MADWTEGYVADIGYTYGYFNELNPLRAQWALLNQGIGHGMNTGADAACCELGFGQGLSINAHAAAQSGQWWGTDFNPAQAAFAQDLARTAGSNAQLFDQAFAEFCQRADLPDFDYICLHGIWSWISDDNRRVIADFVRRKLKVGGVLYVSYNSLPGWAAAAPIRHLLTQHFASEGAAGQGIVKRIDQSLAFADKLFATNPFYVRANPAVPARFEQIKKHDRHYLAHEYFNRDWLPMYFSTFAQWMSPAKVTYAASAHLLDHVEGINLMPEQAAMLKATPDPLFRETVRDYCTNQQFRRDLWVKGGRALRPFDAAEAFNRQRVVLLTNRQTVNLKVQGGLGEADLKADIYGPVLDALADHQPRSFQDVVQAVAAHKLDAGRVREALTVLLGNGTLQHAQDEATAQARRGHTDRLNRALMLQARSSGDVGILASPVTGGGVPVARFQQLFLLARGQGMKTPQEWAAAAWQVLKAQNQKIVKDDKTLDTDDENFNELHLQAQVFADVQLPILKAVGVAS